MKKHLRLLSLLVLAALCCSMTAASKKKVAPVRQDNSQPINGHWFVDLGLPSGLLWAATNVGAEFPADEGFYFAWGETKPKDRYVYSESQVINRYLQSKESVLARADDAATVNWSAPCRMPVQADIDELEKNCTMRDTLLLNASLDFVMCKLLKSKINGNEICIPVAGYREGANVYFHDKIGVYWGGSLNEEGTFPCALALSDKLFDTPKKEGKTKDEEKGFTFQSQTYYGFPIRPVAQPVVTVNPNRQKNVEKQQSHASAHTDKSKVVNGHKFVDLGLPSGTLWAETNIGAKTEADCGDYFVWGETAPKSNYDEATYKNENALAITDDNPEGNNRLLKSGNDAALSNWGSPCRMSCAEDWKELQNCCEMIPVALYDSAGEKVKGLRLVSKANGNTLTFPLSGLKRYNDVLGKNDYFFISLKDCDKDGSFGTYKGGKPGYDDIHIWKFDGLSVRPVISK